MMSLKVGRLIQRERALMLQGKGVVESVKDQLYAEEAEQFYASLGKKHRPRKYQPSTDERIGKWASNTAEMLHSRKQKRGKM